MKTPMRTAYIVAAIAWALLFAFTFLAHYAHAEDGQIGVVCGGNRAKVIAELQKRYGEVIRAVGLSKENSLLEVYASPESGTWTIMITSPEGRTCLIAAGDAWEMVPERKPGEDL